MSYTDIICVFMCDNSDNVHDLAQEWLDAMPATTDTYIVFSSLMAA